MKVSVDPYSAEWPRQFAAVRSQLRSALNDERVAIEHIGSTAVPGLCAKPVIDVLAGAESLTFFTNTIPRLAAEGYVYVDKYERELPMRRYFVKLPSALPRVHVHAVCERSDLWIEQLAFRDALRADQRLRDAYADLKRKLALEHADTKADYTAAKAPFIRKVLSSLGLRPPDPA